MMPVCNEDATSSSNSTNNDCRLPIVDWTDSKVEMAERILHQGFAVYRLDNTTTEIFQQAAREASSFFLLENNDFTSSKKKFMLYQRLSQEGHLMGYNEPSPAKWLFRAFCENNEDQPWPNPALQQASEQAANAVHNLLADCFEAIHDRIESKEARPHFPRACCPLDYFYYHGNGGSGATNCSPHTDRGVLIAIALTEVPGLEILLQEADNNDGGSPSFSSYCPEHVHHDQLINQPYSLVCVMAGDHLKRLLNVNRGGCIHCVCDNLPSPRLSISYEMRL